VRRILVGALAGSREGKTKDGSSQVEARGALRIQDWKKGKSRITENDVSLDPKTHFLEEERGDGERKRTSQSKLKTTTRRITHEISHVQAQSLHDIREEDDGESPRRVDIGEMRSKESSQRPNQHQRKAFEATERGRRNEPTTESGN